ncbi:hypothetical protein EDD11_003636 [Mortierella claussenii]|nr:hypothetical protein EDD11_003636 [Mortierella claussenii]
MGHNIAVTDAAVLTRFQQFHPNRRDLDPKSIFAQTLNALAQRQYTDPNGFVVELDPSKLMAGSRRASAYQNDDIHVLVLDMQWDPEVTVVVGNVLDETVRLRQEGYRPVMLNVGNSHIPGGDYHLDTATDNEADIFRRTTLHQCLDQEPRRTRFYPLPESGGIYCPNQAVFRHGRDKDNEFMDRFEWISVVSVASISKLETREKGGGLGGVQFLEGEDDLLRRKILAAMKVGVSQGHDALILPPHGAEAGQNPAEAIAAIYRSIIGRDFMGGRKRFQTYKKIVMVLDPEQADKIVNETSSYRPLQPFSIVATPLPVQEGEKELSTSQADGQDSGKEPDLVDKKDINARRQKTPLRRRAVYESTNPEGVAAEAEPYKDDQVFVEQSQEGSDVADDADSDRDQIESSESFDELMGDHHDEDGEESEKSDQDTSSSDEGDDESLERQVAESEYIAEEAVGGDELLVDKLALEDEVSESRALMEEQDLEEDADLSEEALDDDLSDIPQILEGNDNPGKSEADPNGEKNTSNNEDEDSENESDGEDSAEVSESSKDEGPVGQQVEEDFVPITETVRQVFERMLEQRSLLIVKNKARGLFESEETGSAPVVVSQSLPVNNTAPSVPDAVSLASLPLVPTA